MMKRLQQFGGTLVLALLSQAALAQDTVNSGDTA